MAAGCLSQTHQPSEPESRKTEILSLTHTNTRATRTQRNQVHKRVEHIIIYMSCVRSITRDAGDTTHIYLLKTLTFEDKNKWCKTSNTFIVD